jgi:CHASE3 domain sensor protein
MNRTELLDGLYATRRELLRLLVATGATTADEVQLHLLVQRRDQITWTINALIDGELGATMAELDKAYQVVEGSTKQLKGLTAVAKDIDIAIGIAAHVLDVATAIVRAAGPR